MMIIIVLNIAYAYTLAHMNSIYNTISQVAFIVTTIGIPGIIEIIWNPIRRCHFSLLPMFSYCTEQLNCPYAILWLSVTTSAERQGAFKTKILYSHVKQETLKSKSNGLSPGWFHIKSI